METGNSIHNAAGYVETCLGWLEDEGLDSGAFETLIDAAGEYLAFLDETQGEMADAADYLAKACLALDGPAADLAKVRGWIEDAMGAIDAVREEIRKVAP